METGVKKEVKTKRGQEGKGRRTGVGTEGGKDGRIIETHNKQRTPDRIKLFFH